MNLAQPLATNVPMTEGEVRRIRMRFYQALAAGMSGREAAAYAEGPDLAEPSVAGGHAQVELTAAPPATDCNDAAQLNLARGSESVATSAPISPPALSASPGQTGYHEKIEFDRLVQHSDRVVFQALLAQNLNAFSEFAFSVVRPGLGFRPNWHLEAMAEKLSQVARGKIRRLIITVPPRSLKSLYASVALPAW